MSLCISIAGGDFRQYYMLTRILKNLEKNSIPYKIKCFRVDFPTEDFQNLINIHPGKILICSTLSELFADCNILICPTPFSKDGIHLFVSGKQERIPLKELSEQPSMPEFIAGGNIPKHFLNGQNSSVTVRDIMKDKKFLEINSSLTAEGLLKYIIENTVCSIQNSNIFIAGYGRCGKLIAEKLHLLGGNIFFYDNDLLQTARGREQGFLFYDITAYPLAQEDFDIVINTIPSPVLKAPFLRKLKKSCVLFETASAPGGFDGDICQGLALNLIKCPGIPGKTAPKTAGEAMADSILAMLSENNDLL